MFPVPVVGFVETIVEFLDMVLNIFINVRPPHIEAKQCSHGPYSWATIMQHWQNCFSKIRSCHRRTPSNDSVSFLVESSDGTYLLSTGQPLAMYLMIWQRTVSFTVYFRNSLLVSSWIFNSEWFVSSSPICGKRDKGSASMFSFSLTYCML